MKLTILAVVFTYCTMAYADKTQNKVDSILDRLERKLMESKQDSLLLSDQWSQPVEPKIKTKIKYKRNNINAALPSQEKLKDLEVAINSIEKEVNLLSSDMERMKEILGKQVKQDSLIEIISELNQEDKTIYRELVVKLDGYTIYKLDPHVGLWQSRKTIPLYSGPLRQGKHKLEITGRVAKVISKELPIDDNIYSLIQQEYDIVVPNGKFRKGYKIKIKAPKTKNFKVKAKILEYSI